MKSNGSNQLLIGALAISAVLGFNLLASWADNRRRDKVADKAKVLGFRRLDSLPFDCDFKAEKISQFKAGHDLETRLVLQGNYRGLNCVVFECRYIIGYGKGKTTHYVLCLITTSNRELPSFELRQEKLWDKITAAFGYEDIDIAHDQEFSKHFYLSGTPPSAVLQLFTPVVTRTLLQLGKVNVASMGRSVLAFRELRVTSENLQSTIEHLADTCQAVLIR